MATRSGQRGREQSQLAGRELFPRERLMSVAWATVERVSHIMELCTPDTRRSNHLYSPLVMLPDALFVYYLLLVYLNLQSLYIYSLISFSPIARVRTGSVAKAGVGSRLNGYRQALLKTV